MRRLTAMALTMAGVIVLVCGPLLAEGGEVRGRFVRRVETAVGEREYLGIEIEQAGRDARGKLLVPQRREDLAARVRRLREGQIEYRWERPLEMGRADFETLMACCSDNIIEGANGEDVIDFEAVRADFEAAKKKE